MVYESRSFPEWSWSLSRHNLFNECLRKYYFQYYAAHNGWLREASEKSRKAYQLKQLQNLYLLFGEALHDLCSALVLKLQNKEQVNAADLVNQLRGTLNQAFLDSRDKNGWEKAVKKKKMLHEMYYMNVLPEERITQIKERILKCVQNLETSRTVRELLNDTLLEIVEVEKLNSFMIGNTKVYVKVDLLLKDNDHYVVVDWKTGKEEEFQEQLTIYALYLVEKYQVPIEKISARLENLLKGHYSEYIFNEQQLLESRNKIIDSIKNMRELLYNTETNQPMSEEYFVPTPRAKKCASCNYLNICDSAKL